MNELKKRLPIKQRVLSIIKAKTSVIVAQKTLNKLQDRIDNARQTIIVEDKTPFDDKIFFNLLGRCSSSIIDKLLSSEDRIRRAGLILEI